MYHGFDHDSAMVSISRRLVYRVLLVFFALSAVLFILFSIPVLAVAGLVTGALWVAVTAVAWLIEQIPDAPWED